ncbi:hypothetical protein Tco_1126978 [Tanacetum coccineum]
MPYRSCPSNMGIELEGSNKRSNTVVDSSDSVRVDQTYETRHSPMDVGKVTWVLGRFVYSGTFEGTQWKRIWKSNPEWPLHTHHYDHCSSIISLLACAFAPGKTCSDMQVGTISTMEGRSVLLSMIAFVSLLEKESLHAYFVRFHKACDDMKITQLIIHNSSNEHQSLSTSFPAYWGNKERLQNEKLQRKDDTIRNLETHINITRMLNEGPNAAVAFMANLSSTSATNNPITEANTHSRTANTEKLSALTAENTKLKAQVTGKTSSGPSTSETPKVLAPGMYNLGYKYIPPPKRANWVKPTPLPKKRQE